MTRHIVIAVLFACLGMHAVAGPREPRALPTDHRVRTIVYHTNEVYRYVGHYGFQSYIEFEPDENIVTISVGDSTAWMINPSGNRIFLKPLAQDALTNMTVISNKRTYFFELHGEEATGIDDPGMIFAMQFVYNDSGNFLSGGGSGLDRVPNPELDPGKYNFNYTVTGPENIAPVRIFDDGEFTFFQFRGKNTEVPAFFLVNPDGSEAIINFRTRDEYIVVERVTSQFTLRSGNEVVCVYNEAKPLQPAATSGNSGRDSSWF